MPDLRAFVRAVLDHTGAEQVDIVAHSLGGTVTREWLRQDDAYGLVRSLVTVASPHHGIINCSPSPLNYWQLPAFGGFTPASAVCVELGRHALPERAQRGRRDAGPDPLPDGDPGHRRRLRLPAFTDGAFPGVPSLDRDGDPADFSRSPELAGATNLGLAGQGVYDVLGTAHLGVWSSPETWRATLQFLRPQNP